MANFKQHVAVAGAVGVVAAVGGALWMVGWQGLLHGQIEYNALFLGILFAFVGGMFPDIDHDTGRALPEVAALLCTLIPVTVASGLSEGGEGWKAWGLILLIPAHFLLHFLFRRIPFLNENKGWGAALRALAVSALCFVPFLFLFYHRRLGLLGLWCLMFGLAVLIQLMVPIFKRFTVHRGILHSIPGVLIYAEGVYLLLSLATHLPLQQKLLITGAALAGALSHLALDEIYAVDFDGMRTKRSFGSAVNLWESQYPLTSILAYVLVIGLGATAFFLHRFLGV